ncbi:MAG: hypothetical protein E5W91_27210 [Mesorhizobium sp.]|uniref:hypothetical protein n=1 Tax=Mesorhizobium sp. TaxID=1871066 RepID=UPI001223C9C1|nr:hypothetical protein [Mesorhizobium sp.]TIS54332.1 MAG: hypothetical protein E5W91_27210 [Mesorhizobium sp.]
MPAEVDAIAQAVASAKWPDGYTLWRTLKNLDDELFLIERARAPVPMRLLRMRAIISKTRAFRRGDQSRAETLASSQLSRNEPLITPAFDAVDFVDQYRALGGMREASDWCDSIEINQWNEETPEAAAFWNQRFPRLSHVQREAVAASLMLRGRY